MVEPSASDQRLEAVSTQSDVPDASRPARGIPSIVVRRAAFLFIYFVAAAFVGRAIPNQTSFAHMQQYVQGTLAMPFEARCLLVPVLRWADSSPLMSSLSARLPNSSDGPMNLMMQIIDSFCIVSIGLIVLLLRRRFSKTPLLFPWLAPWLALWILVCTFAVRYELRLYYPYDLPSVLFFSIGLLACVSDWPLLLLLIMAIGTFNRETTMFLVPVWLACTFTRNKSRSVLYAAAASAIWLLVKLEIHRLFPQPSLGYVITPGPNLKFLFLPHHTPQLLSVLGFLAIPLWLNRHLVHDQLLKRLWIAHIPMILAPLVFGWWIETRLFGELTALAAVTAAIEFEQFILRRFGNPGVNERLSRPLPG